MEQKSDVKNNGPELRTKLPTVESNLIPMNGTNLLLNLLTVRFLTIFKALKKLEGSKAYNLISSTLKSLL